MRVLCLSIIVLFGFASALPKRYDNYTIYSLTPQSEEALDSLRLLYKYEDIEYLTPPTNVGYAAKVLVPPQYQNMFLEDSRSLNGNVNVEVVLRNLQEAIKDEGFRPEWKAGTFDWEYYYPLEDIQLWIHGLLLKYPNILEVTNLKTYENRNLSVVKVTFNPNATKAVFIEAGIHAREWIGPAVATYILNEIIHSSDSKIVELRNKFNWYIAPVTNPDGYAYTRVDRNWRKTRTPVPGFSDPECIGIDPNRNWDFHFGEGEQNLSAYNYTYPGSHAFSEICTRELSRFLKEIPEKLQSYIALHNNAEKILIPYSNTTAHLDNYDKVYKIAKEAANVLKSINGNDFEVGTVGEVMNQGLVFGGSMDWVKETMKVPFVVMYELRGHNFILPADQIIPSSKETLQSILYAVKEAENL